MHSTMGQDRFSGLALMNIHKDITVDIEEELCDVRVARILWKLVIHFPRIAPDNILPTRNLSSKYNCSMPSSSINGE